MGKVFRQTVILLRDEVRSVSLRGKNKRAGMKDIY
jgi:hypothetical protein